MLEVLSLTKKEESALKNILDLYCTTKRDLLSSLRPSYAEGVVFGTKFAIIQLIIAKSIFMTEDTAGQLIDEYFDNWNKEKEEERFLYEERGN